MNHNCFADRDTSKNYVIYASCAGQANGDGNKHHLYGGDFDKQYSCGLCGQLQYILIHVCAELRPTSECTEMCGDCIIRGMQTDANKGMFRPQRHNTPLVTTLGLVAMMSEIESIMHAFCQKYESNDFHADNLNNIIANSGIPPLRNRDMTPPDICAVCEQQFALHNIANVSTPWKCSRCLRHFHASCVDAPPNDPLPAVWVCHCCKRSTLSSIWKWDLEIEKHAVLPANTCRDVRNEQKYILDGVVRVWRNDVCFFYIAGQTIILRAFFWFLVCCTITQLARQIHSRPT